MKYAINSVKNQSSVNNMVTFHQYPENTPEGFTLVPYLINIRMSGRTAIESREFIIGRWTMNFT